MYRQEEEVSHILKSFAKHFNKLNFISSIGQVFQHSDLPKFYSYAAILPSNGKNTDGHLRHAKKASGTSFFSEELALLKCLGEAVERESCTIYRNKNFIFTNYKKIKNKALNPKLFNYFSDRQKNLPIYSEFIYNDNTPFRWMKANELISGRSFYIPAQTVFYNYQFAKNEGRIGIPISTGAAGGKDITSALVRGVLESVERDAFMICYLNKISNGKVNMAKIKDDRIKFVKKYIRSYKIELYVIDITTDLGIPTYLAIGIDKTGLAPAVQVGAKSDFDPISAIIGAISECFITQAWFREIYFEEKKKNIEQIRTIEDRGIFWFSTKNIKNLQFWTKEKRIAPLRKETKMNDEKKLERLTKIFSNKGYQVFWKDISLTVLKKIPYYVVKVVIPQLQPLYLDEECKYLGSKRLYHTPVSMGFKKKEERELNQFPHPFP